MMFTKLLESQSCCHYYFITGCGWGWVAAEKNSRKKKKFRKCNKIKTKCLFALSSLKMFVKIGSVGVWRREACGYLWPLSQMGWSRAGDRGSGPSCLSPWAGILGFSALPWHHAHQGP